MTWAGVDLGGTGLRVATAHGATASRPLDRSSTLGRLLDRLGEALAEARAAGASRLVLAVPSFRRPDGTLGPCPALPALAGVPLESAVAEATGAAEVSLVADAAAAAVGEHRQGTGAGAGRFLCVALGTGANAAAVVGGQVLDTAFGCLGDAGHVLVDPAGPPCACGGRGCLEAVCSGFALGQAGARLGHPDARAVVAAARAGDRSAAGLLETAGTALGRALATWSALVWPERVAVVGGLAGAGEFLLAPARRELARVGPPYIVANLPVRIGRLGQRATLVGATLLAAGPAQPEVRAR